MPNQSRSNGASGSASSKPKATKTARSAQSSRAGGARAFAETAVDLPVGAVLEVSERVADLVEPFSGRTAAEKQLKSYGTRLRRTAKRTERRGATARRKARTRVEREARKRRRTVETTLKRNRTEVEQRVRKAIDEQTARAQRLVDQVGEQVSALR